MFNRNQPAQLSPQILSATLWLMTRYSMMYTYRTVLERIDSANYLSIFHLKVDLLAARRTANFEGATI